MVSHSPANLRSHGKCSPKGFGLLCWFGQKRPDVTVKGPETAWHLVLTTAKPGAWPVSVKNCFPDVRLQSNQDPSAGRKK